MNKTRAIELRADIARLFKKYGAGPFETLAKQVGNDRLLNDLRSIIDTSTRAGSHSSAGPGARAPSMKKRNGCVEFLQRMEKTDLEKANMLGHLHRSLVEKTILPTLKDIRYFAEDNGLHPIKATGRDKAILPLLRALAEVSLDRISQITSQATLFDANEDRSLEGWAGIILGDRNKIQNHQSHP